MASIKKVVAPKDTTVRKLLNGINKGKFYTSSIVRLTGLDYESMKVDINSAPFDIDIRYRVQKCKIPINQRGNLKKYAGKKVKIICSTIARTGARIEFYIKEA